MSRPSPAADMAKLANNFVEFAQESGHELDYSEESLPTVERIIDAEFADWRPWRRGKAKKAAVPVASLVGAYVGEVMVRNLGGTWGWMPEYDSQLFRRRQADGRHRRQRLRSVSSTARRTTSSSTTRR